MKCPTASGVDTPRKLVFGWNRLKTHLKSLIYVPVAIYISTAPIWQLSYLSRTSELPEDPLPVLTFAAYLPQLISFQQEDRLSRGEWKSLLSPCYEILNDSYCVRRNFSEGFRAQLPSIAWWIPWRCNQPQKKGQVTPSNHWISIGLIPQNPPDV